VSAKNFSIALSLLVATALPVAAQQSDEDKHLGTYVSNVAQDFVFVKSITMLRDDKGKIKFRAALSGFPDDYSLGEATAESYSPRSAPPAYKSYLAAFTTPKMSVFMIIGTGNSANDIRTQSFMKFSDGSKKNVFFDGSLQKPDGQQH